MRTLTMGGVVLLALALGGCETDGGIAARAQEKSVAYAALRPWEKKFIDKGLVAAGFTPDMVYIAMGHPDVVETKDLSPGRVEQWTWKRYYPNIDAVHGFRFAPFTTESSYQPQMATMQSAPGSNPNDPFGAKIPLGMSPGGGESIAKTGGPQGGSMEPATLQSYTMQILFANGKAIRLSGSPNMN